MYTHIERVLIDRQAIASRVHELATRIAEDHRAERSSQGEPPADGEESGSDLIIVGLLTGSLIFLADLVRHLPMMTRFRLVSVSSYPGKATASQGVTINDQLPNDLTGHAVLIVDDILDSGRTLGAVRARIEAQRPRSLRTCVLLRKTIPSAMSVACEYVGFDIPDEFVVGYGLDFDGYYRNLPEICILRPEIFS